ncbi:MAG: aminotransferase class V-fold PLP-dependent enzyme [Bacteroidetes bacterium]|nr:aminotransferase class V-fold PLP-dependent enzyme [Bacteroidota bacterium]
MDKRSFLKKAGLLGLAAASRISLPARETAIALPQGDNDEAFWQEIRNGYDLPADFVNFENGYYCVQPRYVTEKYMAHMHEVNRLGARYMRTVQFENKNAIAARLAQTAGVQSDELIITRNTTEALDMVIAGFPWRKGDEAVMAMHDYGAMLDMFKQVARRHGVVNKLVTVPLHPQSDDEIVKVYEAAITKRTKLLMLSHMINITGQILPVKKIADMARSRGVQVMVDGAHAFAHFRFSINDLNCDYYACSLHKWLSAPLGAGFLWMRKEHIPAIWPLFAEEGIAPEKIARLNHTGTHPVHTDLAIADALDYYTHIGTERKENRLRTLHQRITSQLSSATHLVINTPADSARHCAILNIGVKGMQPAQLAKRLFDEHKIYTVAIDNNGVSGCRITPNIYNTLTEADQLAQALLAMKP